MNNRMTVYNYRDFDEGKYFRKYSAEYGIEINPLPFTPDLSTVKLSEDSSFVNVITTPVNAELLDKFRSCGVEYIVTRTIGYDHIDTEYAKKLGIKIANTPYDPEGVSEYTIMLMLMCIRRLKSILMRGEIQDFTLKGILGKELGSMTAGVIGTGRIGTRLIKNLSGFGCRILASSPHENPEVKKYAEYTSLENLIRESDIITLHAPLSENTRNIISSDTISQMKDGVIIINTARGGLIDMDALIEGIESGKIGSAGLDVVGNESEICYYDRREAVLHNRQLYTLRSMPNVIITHHMAFYTENCVETMVRDSIRGAFCCLKNKENPWLIP